VRDRAARAMVAGVLAREVRMSSAQDRLPVGVLAGATLGLSSALPVEMVAQLVRELVVRGAGAQQLAQAIAEAVDPGHAASGFRVEDPPDRQARAVPRRALGQ